MKLNVELILYAKKKFRMKRFSLSAIAFNFRSKMAAIESRDVVAMATTPENFSNH